MNLNPLIVLWALALASCSPFWREDIPSRLEPDRISELEGSVFEVVIPKKDETGIIYANGRTLPTRELPYSERNDKYYTVGTAFAVGATRLVSAAHVFQLDVHAADHAFLIRDAKGRVFPVDRVLRYSEYRDLIEFTVKSHPAPLKPLAVRERTRVGERVYTVGSANGEGIAVRDGQIASYTFEPVAGAWKDIRYSAPASPGNSGGPLLDTKGDVVGIVVRKNENENLNVAVPVAELHRLLAKSAEFFVASAEANTDGEPVRDWRFKTPLPAPLETVAVKAEASRRAFHIRQWRAALAQGRSVLFPYDPALLPYAATQTYSERIQTLTAEGGYHLAPESPIFQRVASSGETVAGMADDPGYGLATIEIAAGRNLAAYVGKPEKILEPLLEAYGVFRDFNGRHLPVKSLGAPQSTGTFTDKLGRPWLKAAWRTWYNESTLLLNCLPSPSGFGCSLDTVPTAEETFGLQEKFEEYYASLLAMSYIGTVSEWQRFLALREAVVPKALRGLELSAGKGKVRFHGGDFRIDYAQPLGAPKSTLFVGVGYGLRSLLNPEIHTVRLEHGPGLTVTEQFDLYAEPPAGATPTQKRFWSSLVAKQRAVNDDGSVCRVLGLRPLKNGKRVAETVSCSVAATCDAILRGR